MLRATRWRVAGVVIVAAVALGAAAAIRLRTSRAATDRADASAPYEGAAPSWERVDTLRSGETLTGFLMRAGVAPAAAAQALHALDHLDPRRVQAGLTMRVQGDSAAAEPNELLLHLTPERDVRFTRAGPDWDSRDEPIQWTTDTIVVHGVVHSTLYDALDAGAGTALAKGARSELA